MNTPPLSGALDCPPTESVSLQPLLFALQLTDSAFPSGLYTLSHGLEGVVQLGLIGRAAGVEPLLEVVSGMLRHNVGPGDATALSLAWTATQNFDPVSPQATIDELQQIDARAHATRLTTEIRVAATRTGRQVLDLANEILDDPLVTAWNSSVAAKLSPGGLPVAMGVLYARGGLGKREAIAADLSALCSSVVGAALRLTIVDHRQAQVVLRRCGPVIEQVAAEAMQRPLIELGGYSPTLDIASAHHENADARLFAS